MPAGEIVERVACRADPSQTYALYLPSSYTPTRAWPLLMLLDPRGRALVPLERFRAAAERFGYIVVSSYNTSSDGPAEPNLQALRAMLPDAEERFSLATRRHYLAGFSGTARLAWDIARLLPDHVAGIIGVGGGFPEGFQPPEDLSLVFFGSAGDLDFNYEEMRALDRNLDELGMPRRFEFFEGPHTWPPAALCARAIAWLEIRAMRAGLRPADPELVRDLLREETDRARLLEESGEMLAAYFLYRNLADDFKSLRDTAPLARRAEELGGGQPVREGLARRAEEAAAHERSTSRFFAFVEDLQTANPPPSLIQALRILEIKTLKKQTDHSENRHGARAAQRELEHIFVYTSFYLPRELLDRDQPDRALAALRIADAIRPRHPRVCFARARAHARLGQTRKALSALDCAADSGLIRAAAVEEDPDLAVLRDEKAYPAIRARLLP